MSNHMTVRKNVMQHLSAQTGTCSVKLVSIQDFKYMSTDRVNIDIILRWEIFYLLLGCNFN